MANTQASVYAVQSKLLAAAIVSYLKSWIPFSPFFLIINTNGERTLVVAFNHPLTQRQTDNSGRDSSRIASLTLGFFALWYLACILLFEIEANP